MSIFGNVSMSIEAIANGVIVRIYSNNISGTYGFKSEKKLMEWINSNLPLAIMEESLSKKMKTRIKVEKSEELKEKEKKTKKRKTRRKK